jgi:aspartyl-tRNA(Asn)/glutamyl-tRNA(Gln) amidotransferase subunit B
MSSSYLPMIGLEVHAQLLTESKMFCGCNARYSGAPPNSHVCPVDLGLPGSLPVINERALHSALIVALALNCQIERNSRFDRKNYPYPDIPKGYQISQYERPLGRRGYLLLDEFSPPKRVGITRAHLEEDTGKTIHASIGGREVSLVDFNRSGIPLLEIVSDADMVSPEEARAYFAALREILVFLGVNSGDMQEGALRADVNVSLRKEGEQPGVKVEIKNLNSFRAVERAIRYEIDRQSMALEAGNTLPQETRGWDEARGITVAQRSKEFAEDYRYFPEPDLPPITFTDAQIERIRASSPELAAAKRMRFVNDLGLSPYDARVLTQDPTVAALFEATIAVTGPGGAKSITNWLTGEFLRLIGEGERGTSETLVTASGLAELVGLVADSAVTTPVAKVLFEEMFKTGASPAMVVEQRGLRQVSDRGELVAAVELVLAANEMLVADYVNKDRKTEGPLVGKVMAATGGKANPTVVKEMIAALLLAGSEA